MDIRNATIIAEGKKSKSVKAGAAKGVVADLVVINPKSREPSAVFVDGRQRI